MEIKAKNKKQKEEIRALLYEYERRKREKLNDSDFMANYIKIANKEKSIVPFVLNPIQRKIEDTICKLESENKPVRVIVLKARQEGVSTYVQGKFLKRLMTTANQEALVLAHNDKATSGMLEKARLMLDNVANDVKPLTRATNANEIVFNTPTGYKGNKVGLNSKIAIQTAGKSGVGRSFSPNLVHVSEFAFWGGSEEDSPDKQLMGIMASVPKTGKSIVVIESTAQGFNEFKDMWDDAVAGRNDFIPLFFAWHDMPEYKIELEDEDERQRIIDSLSDYEEKIMKMYNLSCEQIKWYRWTMRNDCQNNHDLMKQENPSFPTEAFLSTGRPVFNNEKINDRIEELKLLYDKEPPMVGDFKFKWNDELCRDRILNDGIVFHENKNGYINIYEKPIANNPYVIGGDTKGEGKDFFTATVINNITGKRAATLRMDISNSKPYTWQVYCLGMYYNTALIGIEMNFNTAPIEELERLGYPKQYMRQAYDTISNKLKNKYGWKTDGNTRPLIIDKEVDLIDNNIELFTDIDMLIECLTFVYDKDNRPDAMSGKHDDLLFSDMIANEIRGQQTTRFISKAKSAKIDDLPKDILEDLKKCKNKQEREYILRKIGRLK